LPPVPLTFWDRVGWAIHNLLLWHGNLAYHG
jgi:hypothetical protein